MMINDYIFFMEASFSDTYSKIIQSLSCHCCRRSSTQLFKLQITECRVMFADHRAADWPWGADDECIGAAVSPIAGQLATSAACRGRGRLFHDSQDLYSSNLTTNHQHELSCNHIYLVRSLIPTFLLWNDQLVLKPEYTCVVWHYDNHPGVAFNNLQ